MSNEYFLGIARGTTQPLDAPCRICRICWIGSAQRKNISTILVKLVGCLFKAANGDGLIIAMRFVVLAAAAATTTLLPLVAGREFYITEAAFHQDHVDEACADGDEVLMATAENLPIIDELMQAVGETSAFVSGWNGAQQLLRVNVHQGAPTVTENDRPQEIFPVLCDSREDHERPLWKRGRSKGVNPRKQRKDILVDLGKQGTYVIAKLTKHGRPVATQVKKRAKYVMTTKPKTSRHRYYDY